MRKNGPPPPPIGILCRELKNGFCKHPKSYSKRIKSVCQEGIRQEKKRFLQRFQHGNKKNTQPTKWASCKRIKNDLISQDSQVCTSRAPPPLRFFLSVLFPFWGFCNREIILRRTGINTSKITSLFFRHFFFLLQNMMDITIYNNGSKTLSFRMAAYIVAIERTYKTEIHTSKESIRLSINDDTLKPATLFFDSPKAFVKYARKTFRQAYKRIQPKTINSSWIHLMPFTGNDLEREPSDVGSILASDASWITCYPYTLTTEQMNERKRYYGVLHDVYEWYSKIRLP